MADETKKVDLKKDEATIQDVESEVFEDPGAIRSKVTLMLHTKEALKIFMGRKEDKENGIHHIPGISVYAKLLRTIWGACLSGQPFAKYWIQKIEIKLAETEQDLKQFLESLKEHESKSIFNISKSLSVKPVEVELNFATPYTYKVVYCLVLVDEIAAKLITLRHLALIPTSEFNKGIRDARGAMNRLLNSIGGFKPLDITLNDVRERNAKYIEGVEAMGELPDVIVKNKYVPEFSPTRQLNIVGFRRGKKTAKDT